MLRPALHTVCIICISTVAVSAQDVSTWALATELRIGAVDRPEYSLTTVSDVEVGPDGRIFVAQPMEQLIRVYDQHGRFLYNVGRRGDGPGEFQGILRLGYLRGRILVLDNLRSRFSKFGADGRYFGSWGILSQALPLGLIGAPPSYQMADGSLVVIPSYFEEPTKAIPLMQFDSTGVMMRTLGFVSVAGMARRARAGDLMAVIPQPVSARTLIAADRHGRSLLLINRVFGTEDESGEFHVVRVNVTGDTTLSRRYRVAVREIDRTALEDTINSIAETISHIRPFPASQIVELYRDGWRVPEFQAPVDQALVSDDGTVWLREGAFLEQEAKWLVLDEEGALVAQLRIPTSLNVMRVSRHDVWGTEIGEHGESYVVRKNILRR